MQTNNLKQELLGQLLCPFQIYEKFYSILRALHNCLTFVLDI